PENTAVTASRISDTAPTRTATPNTARSESFAGRRKDCKAVTPNMKTLVVTRANSSSRPAYQKKDGLKTTSDQSMTTSRPSEKKAPDGVRNHENRATGQIAAAVSPRATMTTNKPCTRCDM